MLPQQQVVGSVKCISTFHFWIPIFVGQKRWERPVANVPIKSICHLLLNNLHFFIQLIVNFCISFPHCLIQIVSEPCKFTQTLKLLSTMMHHVQMLHQTHNRGVGREERKWINALQKICKTLEETFLRCHWRSLFFSDKKSNNKKTTIGNMTSMAMLQQCLTVLKKLYV